MTATNDAPQPFSDKAAPALAKIADAEAPKQKDWRAAGWDKPEKIAALIKSNSAAKEHFIKAKLDSLDKNSLELLAMSLKNEAETLAASSDGIPLIIAFYAAFTTFTIGAARLIPKFGIGLGAIAGLALVVVAAILLVSRLKTRRMTALLKKQANYVEYHIKTLRSDP